MTDEQNLVEDPKVGMGRHINEVTEKLGMAIASSAFGFDMAANDLPDLADDAVMDRASQYLRTCDLLREVMAERRHQDEQWGGAAHDDHHIPLDWIGFIRRQANEADREQSHRPVGLDRYRRRLVKIAALAIAAAESYDRGARP